MNITFTYLNHRGETSERTIEVDAIKFNKDPGYNYQPGWFISGFDPSKNGRRSFALNRIILPEDNKTVFTLMRLKCWGTF